MSKSELIKRYLVFFLGMLCVSFGIAFATKAELGTSPLSAIPYSLSLIIPRFSIGNWTIVFSIGLVLSQLIMLGKEANKKELLLQAVISFVFGYVIDFAMFCLSALTPTNYGIQLLFILAGCIGLSIGAYLQVVASVVMLPGDGFVTAISKKTGKEYGAIRVISDISMAVIAGIMCLAYFHKLAGVREGTLIAALVVGNLVKIWSKIFKPQAEKLFPKAVRASEEIPEKNFVITISREFGSGGREIGRNVAKALGISYFDTDIIHKVAEESGYTEEFIQENEQKMSGALYHLYSWYTPEAADSELSKMEELFHIEERVIRGLAAKGSCVIVGRLADYILRDHENAFHVFVAADIEDKVKRVVERDGISETEARKKIQKVEKERETHCRYFAHMQWGKAANYDLAIKSSRCGIEKTAEMLATAAKSAMTA